MKAALSFLFFVLYLTSRAQLSLYNDPYQNQVILAHYKPMELQYLQQNDTAKFNTIVYYYTSSFVVEAVRCNSCSPVDLSTFDVAQYEYLREKDKRFVRYFEKYGFKLTLLSINELTYKLPIHSTK